MPPLSTHSEWPVLQEVDPVWHSFAGVQVLLSVQETHVPERQT